MKTLTQDLHPKILKDTQIHRVGLTLVEIMKKNEISQR